MAEKDLQKLKTVIFCSDFSTAQTFERGFSRVGAQPLGIAKTAEEAIRLVQEEEAELIVMEPFLPGINCDELADLLEREASPFLVKVAISDSRQDLLAARFLAKGGDLFRMMPLDYRFTFRQICELAEQRLRYFASETSEIENAFGDILYWFGMRRTLKGYRYIRDAAALALENPGILSDLKNRLYPILAMQERAGVFSVEKCIRTAIESTCKEGDLDRICQYFCLNPKNGKIGNGEFITQIIDLYQKGFNPK